MNLLLGREILGADMSCMYVFGFCRYDQLTHRFNEARSRALKSVFRTIEDMIVFREHVTDSLGDLKTLTE